MFGNCLSLLFTSFWVRFFETTSGNVSTCLSTVVCEVTRGGPTRKRECSPHINTEFEFEWYSVFNKSFSFFINQFHNSILDSLISEIKGLHIWCLGLNWVFLYIFWDTTVICLSHSSLGRIQGQLPVQSQDSVSFVNLRVSYCQRKFRTKSGCPAKKNWSEHFMSCPRKRYSLVDNLWVELPKNASK